MWSPIRLYTTNVLKKKEEKETNKKMGEKDTSDNWPSYIYLLTLRHHFHYCIVSLLRFLLFPYPLCFFSLNLPSLCISSTESATAAFGQKNPRLSLRRQILCEDAEVWIINKNRMGKKMHSASELATTSLPFRISSGGDGDGTSFRKRRRFGT